MVLGQWFSWRNGCVVVGLPWLLDKAVGSFDRRTVDGRRGSRWPVVDGSVNK